MADKSNFTADEWRLLLESVTMAGIAVSAADPSGLWGFAQGEPCQRQRAREGENRFRGKPAHQSRRRRF